MSVNFILFLSGVYLVYCNEISEICERKQKFVKISQGKTINMVIIIHYFYTAAFSIPQVGAIEKGDSQLKGLM